MKIKPPDSFDADCKAFFYEFDEQPPCSVLAIGSNEEDTGNLLVTNGFDVVAYDLRDPLLCESPKYLRWKTDFVAHEFYPPESFDVAYSLSAIEHFGLTCYGGVVDEHYDVKALLKIWTLLKKGGTAYITVPVAGRSLIAGKEDGSTHWRIYGPTDIYSRIVTRFSVERKLYFKSNPYCPGIGPGRVRGGVEWITEGDAERFQGEEPHVTTLLTLRKDRGF